jgi:hypothetical protein
MTANSTPNRRQLTDVERTRLESLRQQVQAELPDIVARNHLRAEARQEPTLSGALRRAVHDSRRPLHHIAREIDIPPEHLDEFLTGERNLLSDAMNRLAKAVGVEVRQASPAPTEQSFFDRPPADSGQNVSGG